MAQERARLDGRLWLDRGERSFLGHGRVELLSKIAEHGSISAAARAMGMSYKAAWKAVEAMNHLADHPLVVRVTGGRHGGGTRLTDHGLRTVAVFRRMEAEYRQFLERLGEGIDDFDRFYGLMRRFAFRTTAGNQFRGRVERLRVGAVNAEVTVELPGGDRLVAIVTIESVDSLRLAEGGEVYALIKESSVLLAPEAPLRISARNRLCGTILQCREGAVNGEVSLGLGGEMAITAIVTNESIRRLALREGGRACALIKASDVILAVND